MEREIMLIKRELGEIEDNLNIYQLDGKYSADDESNVSNSVKMYINEILKYPLLKEEEEVYYAEKLKNPQDKKLLLLKYVGNLLSAKLDIPLLFISLCDNKSYNLVIEYLLSLYSKLNSSDNAVEEKLIKYQKISKELGRALNEDEIKEYFDIDSNKEKLSEKDLLNEVKDFMSYKYAFDKMFVSNLRLVVSVAKYYRNKGELLELINEGNLGLYKAIEKYDSSLGFRFSTYAIWHIKQMIKRSISNNNAIRVPEYFSRLIAKFKNDVEELEKKEERELSLIELSEKLDISLDEIMEYQRYMYNPVSLDQQVSDDSDTSILDLIPRDDSIEEDVFQSTLRDDIKILLGYLTSREEAVIRIHFGIGNDNGKNMSFTQIGKIMNVSPSRVSQIEARALFKMRRFSKRNKDLNELRYYLK